MQEEEAARREAEANAGVLAARKAAEAEGAGVAGELTQRMRGSGCFVEQLDCKGQFLKGPWQAAWGEGLEMHGGMH